jgi:hypothetical protein
VLAIAMSACARDAIEWQTEVPLEPALASASLAFDPNGRVVPHVVAAIATPQPVFSGQCAGSVRVARDSARGGSWFAAWWAIRPDSTAEVMVARSADGITWTSPVRVDSTDVGHVGCRRPPPSIAADAGNVHVAYAMTAREGPGIFASHSMGAESMFHSPVAIVYGERPGATAIAAQGDLVVIAYEDPNSDPPRIGVAVSRTMAHNFLWRGLVSPSEVAARAPGVVVGARGARIAVTWARATERAEGTDGTIPRMIRTGTLQ